MKRFQNILLVFDEGVRGEAALARAATLAKENQAQLTVVEVIREMPPEARRLISVWRPLLVEDPQELLVRERQEQLAQFIQSIRQQGVEGDTRVLVGAPFLEVTREVLRNGHDLVIVTASPARRIEQPRRTFPSSPPMPPRPWPANKRAQRPSSPAKLATRRFANLPTANGKGPSGPVGRPRHLVMLSRFRARHQTAC